MRIDSYVQNKYIVFMLFIFGVSFVNPVVFAKETAVQKVIKSGDRELKDGMHFKFESQAIKECFSQLSPWEFGEFFSNYNDNPQEFIKSRGCIVDHHLSVKRETLPNPGSKMNAPTLSFYRNGCLVKTQVFDENPQSNERIRLMTQTVIFCGSGSSDVDALGALHIHLGNYWGRVSLRR